MFVYKLRSVQYPVQQQIQDLPGGANLKGEPPIILPKFANWTDRPIYIVLCTCATAVDGEIVT